jgi:hypothetical protein
MRLKKTKKGFILFNHEGERFLRFTSYEYFENFVYLFKHGLFVGLFEHIEIFEFLLQDSKKR